LGFTLLEHLRDMSDYIFMNFEASARFFTSALPNEVTKEHVDSIKGAHL